MDELSLITFGGTFCTHMNNSGINCLDCICLWSMGRFSHSPFQLCYFSQFKRFVWLCGSTFLAFFTSHTNDNIASCTFFGGGSWHLCQQDGMEEDCAKKPICVRTILFVFVAERDKQTEQKRNIQGSFRCISVVAFLLL